MKKVIIIIYAITLSLSVFCQSGFNKVIMLNGKLVTFQGKITTTAINMYNIDYYYANHNTAYLDLQSHYPGSDSSVIHPSILDFNVINGGTWNGYRYWMAYTPLPAAAQNDYEDPTIVVSNDFQNWITPPGGSNPIIGGGDVVFHADAELFYDTDTDSLYCFYIGNSPVWVLSKATKDGITWTAEKELIDRSTTTIVSPSVIKENGTYKMYVANRVGSPPYEGSNVVIYETSNINTGWTRTDTLVFDTTGTKLKESADKGHIWYVWHLDINKINDEYLMSAYIRNNSETYPGMYLAKSTDGINFDFAKYRLMSLYTSANTGFWDENVYRFSVVPKEVNNQLKFDMAYSGWAEYYETNPVYIGTSEIDIADIPLTIGDSNIINETNFDVWMDSAINRQGDYVIGDKFDRIRTTGYSLDTTSSGYTYEYGTYNYFRTNNGYGYALVSSPDPIWVIDSLADYEWSMIYYAPEGGSNVWFLPKYIDDNNFILVNNDNNEVKTVIGGVYSSSKISTYKRQLDSDLDFVKMTFVDSTFTLYTNGCKMYEYTFTVSDFADEAEKNTFINSTKKGMRIRDISWRMYGLSIKGL